MNKSFKKITNKFVEENEPIIYYALSKYPWVFKDEDLIQEARIWLCEAKYKFNKNKSSWKTFSSNYIQWRYKNYLRVGMVKSKLPELNGYTNVGLDAIQERDLFNICNDKESTTDCVENSLVYDSVIDSIESERNKQIVILRSLGWLFKDIGKRFNISKQAAWLIYKEEIQQIKTYLDVK